ncbi:MAG: hypothetical protein WC146_03405 [Patescibacteria group bacterium]|jgi:hypothetical protein
MEEIGNSRKIIKGLLISIFSIGLFSSTIIYFSLGYNPDLKFPLAIFGGLLMLSLGNFFMLLVRYYIERKEELRKQRQ